VASAAAPRAFGTAAAGLLEAEVVTADGNVRTVNAGTHPDLFWAIKGGGGGSWGVVTRLTLRTHELPAVLRRRVGHDPGALERGLPQLIAASRFYTRVFSIRTGRAGVDRIGATRSSSRGLSGARPATDAAAVEAFFAWVKRGAAGLHRHRRVRHRRR